MPIEKIQQGADSRLNWRTINQIIDERVATAQRLFALEQRNGFRQIYGGSPLKCYILKQSLANYVIGHSWDGTTEGTEDVLIAKNLHCRQPATATLLGVAYTYTYTIGTDGHNDTRESDDGATTETQMVTPVWVEDDEIWAIAVDYSGVTADGADLKLMEVSPRCWAKVSE